MVKHAKKSALSQHAAYMAGALSVYLGPKLAKDASIDLKSILKGTTARNFKVTRPTLVHDIKKAVVGKLAKDASIEDVNMLLDKLQPDKKAMDDEEEMADGAVNEEDLGELDEMNKDDEPAEMDPQEQELRMLLEGKLDPDEIAKVLAMCKPAAVDELPKKDDEPELPAKDAKEDDKDEKKEPPMKDTVSKTAMDAALRKNRDDTIAEMKRQFNARTEAQELVRPLIGEVTIAMDTDIKIYGAALDHAGVDHDDIKDPKALRRMTEMAVKAHTDSTRTSTQRKSLKLAEDHGDALTNFAQTYGIEQTSMRHI